METTAPAPPIDFTFWLNAGLTAALTFGVLIILSKA